MWLFRRRAAAPAVPTQSDGLPLPQRYWAILTIALGISLAVLDGTMINVALPVVARDLDITPAASIWVVNAYQLALTLALLPLASLGDIIGYRTVYRGGLLLFSITSLACALADSLTTLAVARLLQGLAAAGIMSVNTALLRFIYPFRSLGRGIGLNSLIVAVSMALGPSVAAGMLAIADWPWLFAVNVPIALAALAISTRALPYTQRPPHRFDWLSALLNALTFGLLIGSVSGLAHGASAGAIVAALAGAIGFGYLLVRRQLNRPLPLLPVDLFRVPMFSVSIAASVCAFAAQTLAFVSLPFFLHDALGRSAVETGLLMTPWPVAVVLIAPVAGFLADRYPVGALSTAGLLIFSLGFILLALLPPHPDDAAILWRMAVCGLGFGLFQSPHNRAIIGSAPRERSGGASGTMGTARVLGQTLGAALAALVFALTEQRGGGSSLVVAAMFAAVAAAISGCRLLPAVRGAAKLTEAPQNPSA